MTAQTPATPPADTKRQPDSIKATEPGTEYVILARTEETWSIEDQIVARTPEAAIRKSAESAVNQPDAWVAIPARSWKPVKVTPLTVTTLKLEEAK